jgi:hypothetical protein
VSQFLPLSEESLVRYWLRSGVTWPSAQKHRSRLPRYLGWLADQGVTGVPAHRARNWQEAKTFALSDNLITLQMLQVFPSHAVSAAHHLRNILCIREWHP